MAERTPWVGYTLLFISYLFEYIHVMADNPVSITGRARKNKQIFLVALIQHAQWQGTQWHCILLGWHIPYQHQPGTLSMKGGGRWSSGINKVCVGLIWCKGGVGLSKV
jgi:hypothetical protein